MESTFLRHEAEDSVAFAIRASKSTDHENAHLRHLLASQSRYMVTDTDSKGESVRIRYCVLGERKPDSAQASVVDNRPRVLMIMGLAASLDAWKPQIHDIMSIPAGATEPPVVMCLPDNRGVGWSSSPHKRTDYSTKLMAKDARAVMDEIGWDKAHLVGFSMGGMIASKFASLWSNRVSSLTLISATRGGWDTLPRRLPGWGRRRDGLLHEYLQSQTSNTHTSGGSVTPSPTPSVPHSVPQSPPVSASALASAALATAASDRPSRSNLALPIPSDSADNSFAHHDEAGYLMSQRTPEHQPTVSIPEQHSDKGLHGQMHACWTHKLTKLEEQAITAAKFPVLCIHGRHDIVAEPRFGERLAAQLEATLVMLEGAHFIPRECGHQVSLLIENLVLGQSRALERAHLDPDRHMQPEIMTAQPIMPYSGLPDYAGDPGDCSPPAELRRNATKRSSTQLPA